MRGEALITINGRRLHIVRMAVDIFRAVMEQGTEEKDPAGVLGAMTPIYQEALVTAQKLLDMPPERRIQ